ncbi:PREDICTED: uncharacterized protein LOC107170616 [Diuraphis noxia]|uniref:uncharacterized protein LOC107170616 n=1 Tax=Diuraphis noxia TaxID=143948 RepID=UPI000763689E|nr:PREDICTED: uncharacterized protein LOC107170616 [Diuraphis noxia]
MAYHMMDITSKTMPNSSARHKSCNATKCLCPFKEKRNYQIEYGSWEIVMCHICNSYGTHRVCSFLKCFHDWSCKNCIGIKDSLNFNGISSDIREEKMLSPNKNMVIDHMDASSETILNNSIELSKRHGCNVKKCLCPYKEKQNFQEEIGSWELLLCHTCGFNATHRICSFVKCFQVWYCTACQADSAAIIK